MDFQKLQVDFRKFQDKWSMKHGDSYEFTLKKDPTYVALFNFGKHRVLLYQLIHNKLDYTITTTYDNDIIKNILDDWEMGKVYVKLNM
jgi:hypothetical protein